MDKTHRHYQYTTTKYLHTKSKQNQHAQHTGKKQRMDRR